MLYDTTLNFKPAAHYTAEPSTWENKFKNRIERINSKITDNKHTYHQVY